MAEVGTYYITIMPEMSSFTGQVKSALGSSGTESGKSYSTSFLDVVKGSALGATLGNLASKAGGYIASGLSTGISRLDTIKNYPKVMESLGYSTQDADRSIQTIMTHLDGLPTATQDMVTLTQAISDSTGDLDLATAAALGFNDMMLANGASADEMATAQGVLNRVLGKGSATAAQWQSLTSVMPAQLNMVAKSMLGAGASSEDLHAALEDGTLSWNDFLQAIADLDKNGYIDEAGNKIASFEEQARANSHGIGTAIDNIRNRIGAGWAQILDKVGQEEISSAIDKMSYGIKNAMYRVADVIGYLKDTMGKTKIAESLGKIGQVAVEFFQGLFSDWDISVLKRVAEGLISIVDGGLQWIADHGDLVKVVLGGISGAIAGIIGWNIGTKLAALPATLTAVWTALSANPFVLIATAIAAVVMALYTFFTQTETGKAIWQGFCETMKALWEGLKNDFNTLVETIKQRLEESAAQWEVFKANVSNVIEGVKRFLSNLKEDVSKRFEAMKTIVTASLEFARNYVVGKLSAIKADVLEKLNNIKTDISNRFEAIKTIVTAAMDFARNYVIGKWSEIKSQVSSTVESMRGLITDKWNAIKSSVNAVADNIKGAVSDKFNTAKSAVLSTFDGIKNGIHDKLQWAYDKVRGIVDRIRDLFDFKWILPRPSLPHIEWHWHSIGGMLSIPVFDGVSWYAKGGVFDAATLIGIGEKGREAALPLNRKTYGEIARGITSELGGGGAVTVTGNTFVIREEADIDRIADALNRKIRRERMAML